MNTTSDVLYRAADLIEERGWVGRDGVSPWGGGEGQPVCLEGALIAALGVPVCRKTALANTCPAGRAVREYLNMPVVWTDEGGAPHLYAFNDEEGRTASEVVEVLRAAAVVEAARESAPASVGASA